MLTKFDNISPQTARVRPTCGNITPPPPGTGMTH